MSEPWAASGECVVRGAGAGPAAALLRLSRAWGVAPVGLQRRRSALLVRVSRKYAAIGYFFALLMGFVIYGAIALEVSLEMKRDRKKHESVRLMFNCTSYVLTSVIIAVAARRGTAGILRFLAHYTTIQKIYVSIENEPMSRKLERLLSVMLAGSMAVVTAECGFNLVGSTRELIIYQRSWPLHILQKLIYVVYYITSLLVLQIAFTVTATLWAIKALNRSIIRLHTRIQSEGGSSESRAALCGAVGELTRTYAALRAVCERVNVAEGAVILLLLLDYTFRLVVFSFFTSQAIDSPDTEGWKYAYVVAQGLHFFRIVVHMVMLVDPCHRTHGELKRSQELISEALCAPATALDGVSTALRAFHGATEPRRLVYTPLGTFSLSSSVYTALFGGLTTLIVIIINI